MIFSRLIIWTILLVLTVLAVDRVHSQSYPNKPIRMITSPAGGGNDAVARLIAPGISGPMGQQVLIDNRPTRTLPEVMMKSPPDGYTLLITSSGLWLFPFMANVNYDVMRDFNPIVLAAIAPCVVVVHPSLPAKSVKELIALAKAKPGQLNYSVGGLGGTSHLSVELFKVMTGIKMVQINYKSGSQEIADLIGGHVQLAFSTSGTATPYVKSGRLRALAVTTAKPTALFPGLPTIAASGLPGYEAISTIGVFVPAKTPEAIIKRVNQEVAQFVHTPEAKKRFLNAGVEPAGSSPEAFAALIKSDIIKWGKFIQEAGIRSE